MPLERWKRATRAAALDLRLRGWTNQSGLLGSCGSLMGRFRNVESSLLLFSLPHCGGNVGAWGSIAFYWEKWWALGVPGWAYFLVCRRLPHVGEGGTSAHTGDERGRHRGGVRRRQFKSLPCVRGGGTSAHTGIGRVVTCSQNLAEDADEGDPNCRRSSPMISFNSADRLQPLSR